MSSAVAGASIASGSDSEPWLRERVVLILCGLVASGKSTFAEQLQQHYPQFHRCNQDVLGDRRQVERLARETLAQGHSVCIDRTNFNAAQRSYWIKIAREFPGTSIWVIVFDTPYETCAERLRTRTSHPTIKSAEQGLYVLSRFAADFEPPAPHEGYDRIISLKPADHPSPTYSRAEIAAVLRRVHDASAVSPANSTQWRASQSFQGWRPSQGNSFRGHPPRHDSGPRYGGVPRGRGFAPSGSLNDHTPWCGASRRGNSGPYGEGRGRRNDASPYGRSDSRWSHPRRTLETPVQTERTTTLGNAPRGAGTPEDPLIVP